MPLQSLFPKSSSTIDVDEIEESQEPLQSLVPNSDSTIDLYDIEESQDAREDRTINFRRCSSKDLSASSSSIPNVGSVIEFGQFDATKNRIVKKTGFVASTELNSSDTWEVIVRYEEEGETRTRTLVGFQADHTKITKFSESSELDAQMVPEVGSALQFGKLDLLTGVRMTKSGTVVSTRLNKDDKWEVIVKYLEDEKMMMTKLMGFKPMVIDDICSNVVDGRHIRPRVDNTHFSAAVIQQAVRTHLFSNSLSSLRITLTAAEFQHKIKLDAEVASLKAKHKELKQQSLIHQHKICTVMQEILRLDDEYAELRSRKAGDMGSGLRQEKSVL